MRSDRYVVGLRANRTALCLRHIDNLAGLELHAGIVSLSGTRNHSDERRIWRGSAVDEHFDLRAWQKILRGNRTRTRVDRLAQRWWRNELGVFLEIAGIADNVRVLLFRAV